jgi:hypothetical protein
MSGIDTAAQAFDQAIGNAPANGPARETATVDDFFGNSLKGVEVDDESPPQGGGDDTDPEGYVPPQEGERPQRRARKQETESEADEEDDLDKILYGEEGPDEDDEGEEDPDEDDEDDEDEEDDADEGEPLRLNDKALERKVIVTVDGEEREVTMREALSGYIRTDTFHQRLNSLNEASQLVQNEARNVVATRQRANELVSDLESALESILPKDLDWDKLFAENPAKARSMQKSFDELQGRVKEFRERRDTLNKEQAAKDQEELGRFVQTEQQKFDTMNPHWRGPKGAEAKQKDLASMARTMKTAGFSDQEIVQVYDSRILSVLLKASKYDRITAARPKANKGRTPPKPGPGRVATGQRGTRRSQPDRVGGPMGGGSSIEQAASVFTNIISSAPRGRRR